MKIHLYTRTKSENFVRIVQTSDPEGKFIAKIWKFWGLYSNISALTNVKFGTGERTFGSVLNSWQHLWCHNSRAPFTTAVVWCHIWIGGRTNNWKYFYMKTEHLPNEAPEADLNMAIGLVMPTESVVLSFWDITTGRTTDGQTTDQHWQASHTWPLKWASK